MEIFSRNYWKIIVTQDTLEHMEAHSDALVHLRECIKGMIITNKVVQTHDMGRIIGMTGNTVTDPITIDTPTLFACRKNRPRPSRVVIDVEPMPTSGMTLILRPSKRPKTHFLISAWPGDPAQPEPTNIRKKADLEYWCNHALIWNEEFYKNVPFTSTWREVLA
jgi:hypothetical protein